MDFACLAYTSALEIYIYIDIIIIKSKISIYISFNVHVYRDSFLTMKKIFHIFK